MAKGQFDIDLTPKARSDLRALRAFERKLIVDGIETHLSLEPTKTSKSRIKKLEQPFWCQFRLRIEDLRIYYDVDEENKRVMILRIFEKGTEQTRRSANDEAN